MNLKIISDIISDPRVKQVIKLAVVVAAQEAYKLIFESDDDKYKYR